MLKKPKPKPIPEHPLKVKYRRLRLHAEEMLDKERKAKPFYEQFVPEWKRIMHSKGLSNQMCYEMAGVLNPKDKSDYSDFEQSSQKEMSPRFSARKRIQSSITRLSVNIEQKNLRML